MGELCDARFAQLQTGPFGSQLHAHEYVTCGVPVVPTEAIADRRIWSEGLPQVSPQKASSLSRHALKTDDILFARRGVQATGKTALVRPEQEGFLCGTGAIRLRFAPNNPVISARYLSHLLSAKASIEWFKFHAIGATMPNLNEGIIRSFSFVVPPLAAQRAALGLLDGLDDKINVNRRMNETLEAMARAIFRDWFVNFGPTRTKMGGSAPYLAPEVWSLFPDALGDDGLPVGWKAGSLRDIVLLNPESWTAATRPHLIQYLDLSGAKNGRMIETATLDRPAHPSRAQRVLRAGDTVVGLVRPGNRSFAHIAEDGLTGSTGFACLRPIRPLDAALGYLAATDDSNIERLARLADGAAYPAVNADVVMATELAVPERRVLDALGSIAGPLTARIGQNDAENRTLAALRDLIIPRLMSGELQVREAEAIAEAAQ